MRHYNKEDLTGKKYGRLLVLNICKTWTHGDTLWKCRCTCGKEDRLKPLCIDHDHKTGKFRGLLCYQCNLWLGLAKDNIQNLKQAVIYLEKL